MSRIDDDHSARRAAERIALEKRQNEQKTKKTQDEANAFSRLLQQAKQQPPMQEAKRPGASLAQQVLAQATRSDQGQTSSSLKEAEKRGSFRELMGAQPQPGSEKLVQQQVQQQGQEQLQRTEVRTHERTSEGRTEDSKGGDERLDDRSSAHSKTAESITGRRGSGELRAGRDGGGSQGGSQGDGRDSSGDKAGAAASFRFNPALMAPVGVAKAREIPSSERLRKLATEIAQKIVESVRVGTNAAGNSEFQIDLRSDVLSGLSIKLSSQNGKIKAVFSGKDRDVLKMLGEHAGALKEALGKRGLTLEDLKIEERG